MADQETTKIFSVNALGPGTTLNGLFEIDEKLSSGGMGEVFRGHEIMSGHPIAIKVVLPELAKDQTIVGLFNKEARILRDLNHPAIVRYMAFGTDPAISRPYLVMEFIDGPSLVDVLKNGPLPLEEARFLIARLASGLDAAHQLGVIHRDVSCDNVIIANGKVRNAKIIDFGIARSTKGGTLLEGKFAGKYNFVSPEQLGLFNNVISEATDVYSLGLVMANVLRGEPINMDGTQFEIIEKRRSVPDLSDIDDSVRPILELMLQPDPAARNVTMQDIVDWLTPQIASPRQSKPLPTKKPVPIVAVTNKPSKESQTAPESRSSPFDIPSSIEGSEPQEKPEAAAGKEQVPARKSSQETVFAPFDQAMAKQAGQRQPDSAQPFHDPLPLSARAPIPLTSVASPALGQANGQTPGRVQSSSRLYRSLFALLGILAVSGLGVWGLSRQGSGPEQATTPSVPALTPDSGQLVKTENPPSVQNPPVLKAPDVANASQAGQQDNPGQAMRSVVSEQELWISRYDGGPCFFARSISSPPGVIAIEGMSADTGIFKKLETDFKTRFGAEPAIEVRPIVENQCGVARFLSGLDVKSAAAMTISLKNDKLKSGDPLVGQISGLGRQNTLVYLIDNDGFVYQIDQHLKRSGDKANFGIKLVELESRKPLPQMVLALASDTPIKGGAVSAAAIANTHMSKLLDAIKRDKVDVDYSFAFFELGGK